ncbi:peptidoglycan-binding protein [Dactylosporangium fulvum]|uniref:Peptidoglycan-binding protein n=1 Tax=Dactylosporangium fulvum TaxID=53359 RepID=A0ABY5VVI8_9ACTN|nr:peptidoglycan-binding domain-containing protein [Dactylosporangium fulvum]UWP81610.1 peptidoglycan-binding protein [Dactylosporangium fulvum]
MSGPERSGGRRRRGRAGKVAVAVAAVAAVGAAAAAGLGLPGSSSDAQTRSQTPPKTAKVTKQTLVDTQTEEGELGHGDTKTVAGKLPGTVTELPAAGATVQRGQSIYRVDDRPVILLYGTLPAYRTLAPGVEGADVRQFEQNLAALGYTGFTVDDEYTSSTATAVRKWQGDLGLTKTGTVELGRVVYASGAVRVDEQKAAVGDPASAALLSYTGIAPVVTAELDVADQRLAKTGTAVTVKLPDGKPVPAKISQVELVIKPAQGNNPAETKVRVTVAPDDPQAFAGLDQVTADVVFAAERKENVLAVPVAALLALAEGGYGLQVVDGTTTRIVAVETGMFAAGKVEVTGDGITDGTVVGMPS